jgi:hypothetical protein
MANIAVVDAQIKCRINPDEVIQKISVVEKIEEKEEIILVTSFQFFGHLLLCHSLVRSEINCAFIWC